MPFRRVTELTGTEQILHKLKLTTATVNTKNAASMCRHLVYLVLSHQERHLRVMM